MIVMLAFVATTVPSMAHAAMPSKPQSSPVSATQVKTAPSHEGCAGHANTSKSGTSHTKDSKKTSCCDGKFCKCAGGSCNGAVKVLGFSTFKPVFPATVKNTFSFEERIATSDRFTRIKRPPRA